MSSLRSYLVLLLLSIFQLTLSVYAKGGGKGSKGSKSKSKSKSKTGPTIVYHENGKCYDEKRVQIPCQTNKTTLIVTLVLSILCVILFIVVVALRLRSWLKKRKKSGKSLGAGSRGIHDDPGDTDSITPLVRGESKETDSLHSYEDKSASV